MENKDSHIQVLVTLFSEQLESARRHESERATVSNMILAIAGALIAVISADGQLSFIDIPSSLVIIILGVFGAMFTLKQFEIASGHFERAGIYLGKIETILPDISIEENKEAMFEKLNAKFPLTWGKPLYKVWILLHIIVAFIGIMLIFSIIRISAQL